jgi:hypothetical protein
MPSSLVLGNSPFPFTKNITQQMASLSDVSLVKSASNSSDGSEHKNYPTLVKKLSNSIWL